MALKGLLRAVGVEPPKFHGVGALLVEHQAKFLLPVRDRLPRAAELSRRLRRERELAFYGDIDFIPTEQYTAEEAGRAYDDAAWVVRLAVEVIERPQPERVGAGPNPESRLPNLESRTPTRLAQIAPAHNTF